MLHRHLIPRAVILCFTVGVAKLARVPLFFGYGEGHDIAASAISIRGLAYRYRGQEKPALDGVDLDVAEGEFVVVMGPSGAGKSTLCTTLNGLFPHFFRGRMEGEVRVNGRPTRGGKVGEFAREVGLVFQDFEAQLFSTNVALEVAFGPENFSVERGEMRRRVEGVLGRVRLEGFEGRQPATLSGGQKQRLAIASVLAIEPRVLCLDEPTTDLDPIGKLGVFEIASELKERDDVTLIVVEHETEETLEADRIVILRDGRVVTDRPAREVLRDVDLLQESRIMPLGVTRFFHEMGFWQGQLPLTPAEGLREFRQRGWRIDPGRHGELVAEDERREGGYGEALIEVEGLTHRYPNGLVALEGVDLAVRRGEFLAVLGQNGSGKTTLVKHFNGLLEPTEGSVRVEDETTTKQGIRKLGQTVGYVFQNPDHQIFSDTVALVAVVRVVSGRAVCPAVSTSARSSHGTRPADTSLYPRTRGRASGAHVAHAGILRPDPGRDLLPCPARGWSRRRGPLPLTARPPLPANSRPPRISRRNFRPRDLLHALSGQLRRLSYGGLYRLQAQRGIAAQYLFLRNARSEVVQYDGDHNARTLDARLTVADVGVHGYVLAPVHAGSLRRCRLAHKHTGRYRRASRSRTSTVSR